jgi:hypothetical protein
MLRKGWRGWKRVGERERETKRERHVRHFKEQDVVTAFVAAL